MKKGTKIRMGGGKLKLGGATINHFGWTGEDSSFSPAQFKEGRTRIIKRLFKKLKNNGHPDYVGCNLFTDLGDAPLDPGNDVIYISKPTTLNGFGREPYTTGDPSNLYLCNTDNDSFLKSGFYVSGSYKISYDNNKSRPIKYFSSSNSVQRVINEDLSGLLEVQASENPGILWGPYVITGASSGLNKPLEISDSSNPQDMLVSINSGITNGGSGNLLYNIEISPKEEEHNYFIPVTGVQSGVDIEYNMSFDTKHSSETEYKTITGQSGVITPIGNFHNLEISYTKPSGYISIPNLEINRKFKYINITPSGMGSTNSHDMGLRVGSGFMSVISGRVYAADGIPTSYHKLITDDDDDSLESYGNQYHMFGGPYKFQTFPFPLSELRINNSKLTSFGGGELSKSLSKTKYIDLTGNAIETFEMGGVDINGSITGIDLSNNNISGIEFTCPTSLSYMNLSGNNLSTGTILPLLFDIMVTAPTFSSDLYLGSATTGLLDLRDQAEPFPSSGPLVTGIVMLSGKNWEILT